MKLMRNAFLTLTLVSLIGGCSHATLTGDAGSVGVTGSVVAEHEALGNGKHMLVVTASPALAETEGSIEQRILIHAQREAARICTGKFEFIVTPNGVVPLAAGFMKRSRSYVFLCS